jgi:CelD/BcsL family acetyltransferase involved in cellulose biosynthesis
MTAPDIDAFEVHEYQGDGVDWNAFAVAHPEVRFCHLSQYSDVIAGAYAYRPLNLVARRGRAIVAVWPTCVASSVLLGRRIVSQPFSEYGGLLSAGLGDLEVERLIQCLRAAGSRLGATQIELHGSSGLPEGAARVQFTLANPYGCAVLKLGPDPDRLRVEVFDHQVRKALQKALRAGVTSFEDHSLELMQRNFWPLFLRSMKRLGSPPHPFAYFSGLQRHYPGELKIFWARAGGELVSALLGFAVGKRIQITNIVSDERHWDLRTNDLVHWEFIKWGCERGYEEFDFGSVRYDGQLRFKKKWGAEIREGGYHVAAVEPGRPVHALSSSSKSLGAAAAIWSRCVPLRLTALVGPLIRKHLIR